jgi:hypothetical protein
VSWRVSGTYLESCNCDAVCPCRRIDGVFGGRSTHGICLGALSWQIVEGQADGTDLSGLDVVIATRYSDDEEGSPWTWILYVDERGTAEQHQVLEEIWSGRLAGDQLEHFPWAWKASNFVGIRPAKIEIDHTPEQGWFRVKDVVSVRVSGPYPGDETVTCVIPGHERSGHEVIAEELRVDDDELSFEFSGVCGYSADFEYGSA